MLLEILIALAAILIYFYFYLVRHFAYWERKGVPHYKGTIVLELLRDQLTGKVLDMGTMIEGWYKEHKAKGRRYFGNWTLTQPTLFLIDLDLCKQVLTKDFNHFVNRDFALTSHEYITKHLFSLEGQEWRNMRTKLTPTFTSGKIKNMFGFMKKCSEQLQDYIDKVVLKEGAFDVKDLLGRFTTDIIATCAFGLETNIIEDPNNDFYKLGREALFLTKILVVKGLLVKLLPSVAEFFNVNVHDPKMTELFTRLVKDSAEYRKKNNVVRNDFLDMLLKVKENKSLDDETDGNGKPVKSKGEGAGVPGEDGLTLEEMTAQAFVFFVAGFETSSSATSFCLYELAKNQEIQERLRGEIDDVLSRFGGEITYQALQEMPYMDQVMSETLRRYASLSMLTRVCTEPYKIPGTDLVLDKGVRVNIPSYAIHHDPDIYPEPFKFDPDRFSEENSKDRHHYAFLPFGEGPRNCIGLRFGKLQVKIGLTAILSRYQLTLTAGTPLKLEIDPYTPLTAAKYPFSLNIARRNH